MQVKEKPHEQARYIMQAYVPRHPAFGTRALARTLGVAQSVVSRVVTGASYKQEVLHVGSH